MWYLIMIIKFCIREIKKKKVYLYNKYTHMYVCM